MASKGKGRSGLLAKNQRTAYNEVTPAAESNMTQDRLKRLIEIGTQKAGKTYSFADRHDPRKPAQWWFQESHEGVILFLVLYTQACRWSRCLSCNLPSLVSSVHVPYDALMAQIDSIFELPQVTRRGQDIRKLIVSNNGSVLDEDTFSSTALMYLIAKTNLHLPHVTVVSLETRPEYVDWEELEFLSRALQEGTRPAQLELAVGFEAFDDHVRNDVFDKGLSLEVFEALVQKMAPYGFRLKCYFMQKPVPEMTDPEAIADIHQAIDYLDALAVEHGIDINLHLNPTYVARGTPLETAFRAGTYSPPDLIDVVRAALHARETHLSIFIGLADEGLAVPGGSFIRPGEERRIAEMERFNRTGDYAILENLLR